jgi:mono/diheme cytochrome c family protein
MKKTSLLRIALVAGILWACAPLMAQTASAADPKLVERGQYLITLGQCNDCHTQGYLLSSGQTPPKDWLTGGDVGFQGPWGTTWGSNLRITLANLSEAEWVTMAKTLRRPPPMPYWVLNGLNDADLKAIYAFIRSLTPVGGPNKAALAPGQQASAPYFELHMPPHAK